MARLDQIIEEGIDNFGLSDFLATVSEVCAYKVQHIEENWQDQEMAKRWQLAAGKILLCANAVKRNYGL